MKRIYFAIFTALASLVCHASSKQDTNSTYKVETFSDVPFITIDGNPVRNRIVWVATGQKQGNHKFLKVANKWRKWSYEFTTNEKCNATSHIRFGESAGYVMLSKWEVVEVETGNVLFSADFSGEKPDKRIATWCKGYKENPPFTITQVKDGKRDATKIEILKNDKKLEGFHLYSPLFKLKPNVKYKVSIRAKTNAPREFSGSVYKNDNNNFFPLFVENSTDEPTITHAKKVGVNFVSFEINSVWTQPNQKPNYAYIDALFNRYLKINPNAKFIPRVRLDPQIYKWWRDSHPDDMMKNSDGSINQTYVSISSPTYRKQANESLALFIDYCEKNYPNNIAGYHPAGGNSREWFYGGTWMGAFSGYDVCTQKAWQKWLERKYGKIENLQKAWKNNAIASFDSIKIPTPDERNAPSMLIDPAKYWNIADFNFFLQDEMVDMVLSLAKTIRKHAPTRLSVLFFGYGFEFSNVRNSPAFSGHYALGKILKSKDVDALAGPISYIDRNFGECKTTMGATESITRTGKLWIDEDDTRTHLGTLEGRMFPGKYSGIDTMNKSRNVLRRNLAQETIRNTGVWWMDLFGHGWFSHPTIWKEMKDFKVPELDIIANPIAYKPQMRLVMDETSMCMVGANASASKTTSALMRFGRAHANRSGLPFGHYLLQDVLDTPTDAKLNVMLSIFATTAEQRKALAKLRQNASNIWCWLPAYIDLDKKEFSLSAVKEATGFAVKRIENPQAMLVSTQAGKNIGLDERFGEKDTFTFALTPILETGDVVLATYQTGEPAIVLRKSGKYPQLFVGGTTTPTALYRYIAKVTSAHVYCEQDAAVYANGAYISITATRDEMHKISLPKNYDVYNALTNEKLAENSNTLQIEMKKGENLFLRLGKGNADLK